MSCKTAEGDFKAFTHHFFANSEHLSFTLACWKGWCSVLGNISACINAEIGHGVVHSLSSAFAGTKFCCHVIIVDESQRFRRSMRAFII